MYWGFVVEQCSSTACQDVIHVCSTNSRQNTIGKAPDAEPESIGWLAQNELK